MNRTLLAPYNSYGEPYFVALGYYLDKPFTCRQCKTEQVWRAAQQKWWYEVAKGYVDSTAVLCRACRQRARKDSGGVGRQGGATDERSSS